MSKQPSSSLAEKLKGKLSNSGDTVRIQTPLMQINITRNKASFTVDTLDTENDEALDAQVYARLSDVIRYAEQYTKDTPDDALDIQDTPELDDARDTEKQSIKTNREVNKLADAHAKAETPEKTEKADKTEKEK